MTILVGLTHLGHRLAGLVHQLSGLAHLLAGLVRLGLHHRLAAALILASGGAVVFLVTRRPRRYQPQVPAQSHGTGVAVAGTAVAAAIAYAAWLANHASPAKVTAAPRPAVTQKIIHHTVIEHIAAAHGIQGWQIVVALAIVVPILAWMIVRLNGHRGFW